MTRPLYLFATIQGIAVAVETTSVEAVVRLPHIVPVSRVPGHVRGLAALRSRVLTIIDMHRCIIGVAREAAAPAAAPVAIVMELSGHGYGLLVDAVHDICAPEGEVQPVRGRIAPQWRPFAHGIIEHDGRSHLILKLSDFITGAPGAQAA